LPIQPLPGDTQFVQTIPELGRPHRYMARPQIPGFSPGGSGPHLTASGSPGGLSSGFSGPGTEMVWVSKLAEPVPP
jgi:hypothetical protein